MSRLHQDGGDPPVVSYSHASHASRVCRGCGRLLKKLRRRVIVIVEPSLVRRLIVAQMVMFTAIWIIAIGYLLSIGGRSFLLLDATSLYETISLMSDALAQKPQERKLVLDRLHQTIIEDYEMAPERQPSFVVESAGKVVYRSFNAPPISPGVIYSKLTPLDVGGALYRARTVVNPSGTRTTMLSPDDGLNVLLTVYSDGFYLMPVVSCLPFLVIPAWLSIRLAMRPWSAVAKELASRGPQDLSPIAYRGGQREVATMVEAINVWIRRVSESSDRERSFVADAAHELRTPLAAMLVNVEALRCHATDGHAKQLMSGVLSSGHRAKRLVNQLLTLMRSEASEVNAPEVVELGGLLQDRMAALSPLAAVKAVELELMAHVQLHVKATISAVSSLVDNLVENAIKYGPQGGTVLVTLSRSGSDAVLTVEDEGAGIPVEMRQRVFDRFFRDPMQREPGSGLGLAIVRSVLDRAEGRISLLDSQSGGLRVEVVLPLCSKEGVRLRRSTRQARKFA